MYNRFIIGEFMDSELRVVRGGNSCSRVGFVSG